MQFFNMFYMEIFVNRCSIENFSFMVRFSSSQSVACIIFSTNKTRKKWQYKKIKKKLHHKMKRTIGVTGWSKILLLFKKQCWLKTCLTSALVYANYDSLYTIEYHLKKGSSNKKSWQLSRNKLSKQYKVSCFHSCKPECKICKF